MLSASLSILKNDLSLDVQETIKHAKNVDKLGAGPAFLGSTSQAQLISIQEKKNLISAIPKNEFQNQILIGTGCNSLNDNINIMRHSIENGFNDFLIMNPAYYKNEDSEVYRFFYKIINSVPTAIVPAVGKDVFDVTLIVVPTPPVPAVSASNPPFKVVVAAP